MSKWKKKKKKFIYVDRSLLGAQEMKSGDLHTDIL